MSRLKVFLACVCLLSMSAVGVCLSLWRPLKPSVATAVSQTCASVWQDPDSGHDLCYYVPTRDESQLLVAIDDLGDAAWDLCWCTCPDAIEGETLPLMDLAAYYQANSWLSVMLGYEMSCIPNAIGDFEFAPLHIAALYCRESSAYILLNGSIPPTDPPNVADPNLYNADGDTALCMAAKAIDYECSVIVQYLYYFGADMSLPCNDRTPCELAKESGNIQIFYLINEYGGCIEDDHLQIV